MGYLADINMIEHDFKDNHWMGIVVNANDSTFAGRCKVRVFGLFDSIEEQHIPWAYPIISNIFAGDGAGSISIPKIGQIVRIQFNNGDISSPEYTAIQNIDSTLIQKIKDDYQGTHVLLYDPAAELTVMYQPTSGFQIYYKQTVFQITPDSMLTLQSPNINAIIHMDDDIIRIVTKNEIDISGASRVIVNADEVICNGNQTTKIGSPPYYHAILGEPFWALLSTMATALDSKMPVTPGVNSGLVEAARQAATSTNVLIGI